MRSVLEFCQVLGQRGQVLGEIDQQIDPFLPVGFAQFGDDLVKCGRHLTPRLDPVGVGSQAPLAMGTRTRLPHSVHDPS